ncbi:unnamed protein product [Paramecium octaurelia]|uniref:Transmembrane protein n=1 Tax=Paramecium octaurelia TaxID=43137 RepID=A0A8S1W1Q7_PAROT|nr:unnamed protein product [Paramecium octaurelia]
MRQKKLCYYLTTKIKCIKHKFQPSTNNSHKKFTIILQCGIQVVQELKLAFSQNNKTLIQYPYKEQVILNLKIQLIIIIIIRELVLHILVALIQIYQMYLLMRIPLGILVIRAVNQFADLIIIKVYFNNTLKSLFNEFIINIELNEYKSIPHTHTVWGFQLLKQLFAYVKLSDIRKKTFKITIFGQQVTSITDHLLINTDGQQQIFVMGQNL